MIETPVQAPGNISHSHTAELGLRKPLMLSTECQVLMFIVGPVTSGALSAIGTSVCKHWKMANIAGAASI